MNAREKAYDKLLKKAETRIVTFKDFFNAGYDSAFSDEFKELFLGVLRQACADAGGRGFDHRYLGAYEDAIAFALEHGWIKSEDVTR